MDDAPRTFKVLQLGRPQGARGTQANEDVGSIEDLVTHHPGANRHIHLMDGVVLGRERPERRSHAYISGDFEEIIDSRVDRYGTLRADQVLLVKDFILEDPAAPRGRNPRAVDVPSPTGGYVSSVRAKAGFVEITDGRDGAVMVRLRHLSDIAVEVGDTVAYGQRLGQQDNVGLDLPAGKAMHVHIEMDLALYGQLRNYMADLAGGRLPIQAHHREGVQATRTVDDGTIRLGQASERVGDLQRLMTAEGYRSSSGAPLDRDGVYRIGMQGALLDFQRAHGLPQTGDIDPATLRMVPPARRREVDRHDHAQAGQYPPVSIPGTFAPGHPDHPDHRPALTEPLPSPVNQPGPGRQGPADRDHPDHTMLQQIRDGVRRSASQLGVSDEDSIERLSRGLVLECRSGGLCRVDHVVVGNGGTRLFAVQGSMSDPAQRRAHVAVDETRRRPVEDSDRKLEAAMSVEAELTELSHTQGPSVGGPGLKTAGHFFQRT